MLSFIAFLIGAAASFTATMIYHKQILAAKHEALSFKDRAVAYERNLHQRARIDLAEYKLKALNFETRVRAEVENIEHLPAEAIQALKKLVGK